MASASKGLVVKSASQSSTDGVLSNIETQNSNRVLQAILASASRILVYGDDAQEIEYAALIAT
jgi:hypothetical protein